MPLGMRLLVENASNPQFPHPVRDAPKTAKVGRIPTACDERKKHVFSTKRFMPNGMKWIFEYYLSTFDSLNQ
jgi:hypothetical protein